MKEYKVWLKDKRVITVKAASIGKIMESMVILHNEDGSVAACFTVEEIAGISAVESVVSD